MPFLKKLWCLLLSTYAFSGYSQDSANPWFPGDDRGFYRYLEDRLHALGSQRPNLDRGVESVVFEFYVTDSGYVDSVKVGQCFNFPLCFQLRQILSTMPRVNATVKDGKTIQERRLYVLDFRLFRDGYSVEPSIYSPSYGTTSGSFKWGVVIIAVVATLIVIFK